MPASAIESSRQPRSAFTLTELMIVIGIIVLFVTLALPAFNLISGSRSIAGAENIVAALVSRARAEAVGNDANRGVAFYLDVATNRYYAAIVAAPTFTEWNSAATYSQYQYVTVTSPTPVGKTVPPPVRYFVALLASTAAPAPNQSQNPTSTSGYWSECDPYVLDAAGGTDVVPLPTGVGAAVINNSTIIGTKQTSEYLTAGVILFAPSGAISLVRVSLAQHGIIGTAANFPNNPSNPTNSYSPLNNIPAYTAAPYSSVLTASAIPGNVYTPNTQTGLPLTGAIGMVLFDKQSFDGNSGFSGYISTSLTNTSSYPPGTIPTYIGSSDQSVDKWLDTYATPLLINRYNGTLIRSE